MVMARRRPGACGGEGVPGPAQGSLGLASQGAGEDFDGLVLLAEFLGIDAEHAEDGGVIGGQQAGLAAAWTWAAVEIV